MAKEKPVYSYRDTSKPKAKAPSRKAESTKRGAEEGGGEKHLAYISEVEAEILDIIDLHNKEIKAKNKSGKTIPRSYDPGGDADMEYLTELTPEQIKKLLGATDGKAEETEYGVKSYRTDAGLNESRAGTGSSSNNNGPQNQNNPGGAGPANSGRSSNSNTNSNNNNNNSNRGSDTDTRRESISSNREARGAPSNGPASNDNDTRREAVESNREARAPSAPRSGPVGRGGDETNRQLSPARNFPVGQETSRLMTEGIARRNLVEQEQTRQRSTLPDVRNRVGVVDAPRLSLDPTNGIGRAPPAVRSLTPNRPAIGFDTRSPLDLSSVVAGDPTRTYNEPDEYTMDNMTDNPPSSPLAGMPNVLAARPSRTRVTGKPQDQVPAITSNERPSSVPDNPQSPLATVRVAGGPPTRSPLNLTQPAVPRANGPSSRAPLNLTQPAAPPRANGPTSRAPLNIPGPQPRVSGPPNRSTLSSLPRAVDFNSLEQFDEPAMTRDMNAAVADLNRELAPLADYRESVGAWNSRTMTPEFEDAIRNQINGIDEANTRAAEEDAAYEAAQLLPGPGIAPLGWSPPATDVASPAELGYDVTAPIDEPNMELQPDMNMDGFAGTPSTTVAPNNTPDPLAGDAGGGGEVPFPLVQPPVDEPGTPAVPGVDDVSELYPGIMPWDIQYYLAIAQAYDAAGLEYKPEEFIDAFYNQPEYIAPQPGPSQQLPLAA